MELLNMMQSQRVIVPTESLVEELVIVEPIVEEEALLDLEVEPVIGLPPPITVEPFVEEEALLDLEVIEPIEPIVEPIEAVILEPMDENVEPLILEPMDENVEALILEPMDENVEALILEPMDENVEAVILEPIDENVEALILEPIDENVEALILEPIVDPVMVQPVDAVIIEPVVVCVIITTTTTTLEPVESTLAPIVYQPIMSTEMPMNLPANHVAIKVEDFTAMVELLNSMWAARNTVVPTELPEIVQSDIILDPIPVVEPENILDPIVVEPVEENLISLDVDDFNAMIALMQSMWETRPAALPVLTTLPPMEVLTTTTMPSIEAISITTTMMPSTMVMPTTSPMILVTFPPPETTTTTTTTIEVPVAAIGETVMTTTEIPVTVADDMQRYIVLTLNNNVNPSIDVPVTNTINNPSILWGRTWGTLDLPEQQGLAAANAAVPVQSEAAVQTAAQPVETTAGAQPAAQAVETTEDVDDRNWVRAATTGSGPTLWSGCNVRGACPSKPIYSRHPLPAATSACGTI